LDSALAIDSSTGLRAAVAIIAGIGVKETDWRWTMVAKVLQRPTLVLTRNWQPVNVAIVARALVLLWNEAARVVDPADVGPAVCA
jgi:hypothetical protein